MHQLWLNSIVPPSVVFALAFGKVKVLSVSVRQTTSRCISFRFYMVCINIHVTAFDCFKLDDHIWNTFCGSAESELKPSESPAGLRFAAFGGAKCLVVMWSLFWGICVGTGIGAEFVWLTAWPRSGWQSKWGIPCQVGQASFSRLKIFPHNSNQ